MAIKSIRDLTIEEVHGAAHQNTENYIMRAKGRAKGIAERAFVEGVLWAQMICTGTNMTAQEEKA